MAENKDDWLSATLTDADMERATEILMRTPAIALANGSMTNLRANRLKTADDVLNQLASVSDMLRTYMQRFEAKCDEVRTYEEGLAAVGKMFRQAQMIDADRTA